MRVIAGSARRIRLEVAPGVIATRPFLEQARGALFNSLTHDLPDAKVLDLYAGSGALGIEALSRGATQAVFIEAHPQAAAVLVQNIDRCGFSDQTRIFKQAVEYALPEISDLFDLIFLDPPFQESSHWHKSDLTRKIIQETSRLLRPQGRLVFRCEEDAEAPPEWGDLHLLRERRYGRSRVCFYGHADI